MQLDGVADQLEELDLPPELADRLISRVPPPLPPRRFSPIAWAAVIAVVLLAAGLGLGAGYYLLGWWHTDTAAPAPAEETEGEGGHDVVRIDEVVID